MPLVYRKVRKEFIAKDAKNAKILRFFWRYVWLGDQVFRILGPLSNILYTVTPREAIKGNHSEAVFRFEAT